MVIGKMYRRMFLLVTCFDVSRKLMVTVLLIMYSWVRTSVSYAHSRLCVLARYSVTSGRADIRRWRCDGLVCVVSGVSCNKRFLKCSLYTFSLIFHKYRSSVLCRDIDATRCVMYTRSPLLVRIWPIIRWCSRLLFHCWCSKTVWCSCTTVRSVRYRS